MLLEIVQPWPLLVSARTVSPKAHVQHLGAAHRLLFMDTFLMSGEVIDGTKTFLAIAVWLVTSERFPVSCFMFSATS